MIFLTDFPKIGYHLKGKIPKPKQKVFVGIALYKFWSSALQAFYWLSWDVSLFLDSTASIYSWYQDTYSSRCYFHVGGQLYLIGGRNNSANGNMDSDSVERYDPFYDEWSNVASLTVPRNRVGVGVVDGVVYAVGGSDGMMHLDTAETYDVEEDKWVTVPPMTTKRIGKKFFC